MEGRKKVINHAVIPLIILLFAYSLRRYFFSGFILGVDAEEFGIANYILAHGPILDYPLHIRFGVRLFNLIFNKMVQAAPASLPPSASAAGRGSP